MTARAYYNENDERALWALRQAMRDGLIAPGVIDGRSIKEVDPDGLAMFTQCHFFAGAGLWSIAARLAGWPDDKRIWSASCPCQPYSQAGKQLGDDDPRNLWPDFFRLVVACRPALVVGEQVAGKAGRAWLARVRSDLDAAGYAARGVDIPAGSVGAPHERNRVYWIGVADGARAGRDAASLTGIRGGQESRGPRHVELERLHGNDRGGVAQPDSGFDAGRGLQRPGESSGPDNQRAYSEPGGPNRRERARGMADAVGRSSDGRAGEPQRRPAGRAVAWWFDAKCDSAMGDAVQPGLEGFAGDGDGTPGRAQQNRPVAETNDSERAAWRAVADDAVGSMVNAAGDGREQGRAAAEALGYGSQPAAADRRNMPAGAWDGAEWIVCHDGKARRAKPGVRLLVNGFPGRTDAWHIAGNAIVPQLAAEVLKAYLETEGQP